MNVSSFPGHLFFLCSPIYNRFNLISLGGCSRGFSFVSPRTTNSIKPEIKNQMDHYAGSRPQHSHLQLNVKCEMGAKN